MIGRVPRPSGGYHLPARRPRRHAVIGDQQIEAALPFQMHEPLGARERRHTLGAQLARIENRPPC